MTHGTTRAKGLVAAAFIITQLFAVRIALGDSHKVLHWAGCGITKKAFMAELAAAYQKKTGVKIILKGGGATAGIRETADGTVDMGGTCRMTLPETDSRELEVQLTPVAWDALVVIVNKGNPLTNITSDQIRALYRGKITNWKQLGGADKPIHLYVRKGRISGVGYAIRQYLFKNSQMNFVSKYVERSSGPLEKAVETDPDAIGMTGVSSARKRNVKMLAIDGRVPTYANVKNGSYGLYRPLYLVASPSPSPEVAAFLKFAQSKEGRAVIRHNGTVPYLDAPNLMRKKLIYGFGVH